MKDLKVQLIGPPVFVRKSRCCSVSLRGCWLSTHDGAFGEIADTGEICMIGHDCCFSELRLFMQPCALQLVKEITPSRKFILFYNEKHNFYLYKNLKEESEWAYQF